jgi:hypothetical protein
LRGNTSLSAQGRRAEMAKVTVDATKLADKVRNEMVTARKTQRDQLVRPMAAIDVDTSMTSITTARLRGTWFSRVGPAMATVKIDSA